ncbi:tetratricopeptide repeat protein [Leptospira interrogans]
MTLRDAYDLPVSTNDTAACDAYSEAVRRLLGGQPGIGEALDRAVAADPTFALPHITRARMEQTLGRGVDARQSAQRAVDLASVATPRERGHVRALERVVVGDRQGALAAIEAHLADYPRDVMVLAPTAGVFGLFGFSGQSGREQAVLDFLSRYRSALDDDWWFLASLAFAQVERGQIDAARANVERALELNPYNANGAHIRAHVHYEAGEAAPGLAWLREWFANYDRAGYMHCHLGWHIALWHLELGDEAAAWKAYESLVQPLSPDGIGAWGPPLNVLTDAASFMFRAELVGGKRDVKRWTQLADFASTSYPKPGLAFADVHIALCHAMAGNDDAVNALIENAAGPAGDLVAALGRGFSAFGRGDWNSAVDALIPIVATHERIGGSRAQRDLIDDTLRLAGLRASRADVAQISRHHH